jgi:hypothetical protein
MAIKLNCSKTKHVSMAIHRNGRIDVIYTNIIGFKKNCKVDWLSV